MPGPRNRKHLLIRKAPSTDQYSPHGKRIVLARPPGPPDRSRHATVLGEALEKARLEAEAGRKDVGFSVYDAHPGLYIDFQSPPDVELALESLEDRRKGIEVVSVRPFEQEQGVVEHAVVFVPDGMLKHFFDRFRQYAEEKTKKGEPYHRNLVDRIESLRKATLRVLWTDAEEAYPDDDEIIWWEIWLRRHDGKELRRFQEFAERVGMEMGERRLGFHDRIVLLAKGDIDQLSDSLDVLNDLAEVRKAKESVAYFVDVPRDEEAEWADDLRRRVVATLEDAPAVCVLDTGITRTHPLLEDLIAPADAMSADPGWGAHDDGGGSGNMGHGTEMAGLAAYGGRLPELLVSSSTVNVRHCLESVKILPPKGVNHPELYGAITGRAVARPEIVNPLRPRVFSMAVTTTDQRDRGQPTSWSAAVDALASGRTFDQKNGDLIYLDGAEEDMRRLFVLSAGNIAPEQMQKEYLDRSDLEPVHDPAHAWNALTVGAFTQRSSIEGPGFSGLVPLASPGDLSPWSTTSVEFQEQWAIKPDVVCEGGNVATDGKNFEHEIPDMNLLSTYYRPDRNLFTLSRATSAATAQVARIAAIIMSDYPDYWPETVRAVVVHSAEWTEAMKSRFNDAKGKKGRAMLVRRYGFGVPSLTRALRSANDALTLVAQGTIRPFSEGKMREMHLHDIPWPTDVLKALGQANVRLRVTLSYFVEPNPSRRGWRRRHRYASHGLRFELKNPTETLAEFRKRLNRMALEEDEKKPKAGGGIERFLGVKARDKGSIHSDIWSGTATDLADMGIIGVYPVSGWWKDQPKRDRSESGARYSLVVSIETEAQNIDIWTPVAQEMGIPVEEAEALVGI